LSADTITPENLEQKIAEKEGAKNLWNISEENAVRIISSYGRYLVAEVKGTTDGRKTQAYRNIRTPVELAPQMEAAVNSDSRDFQWSFIKEARGSDLDGLIEPDPQVLVVDKYIAAALTAHAQATGESGILPFNFVDNPMLETEVLIEYYLNNTGFYKLNKQLLDIEDLINPDFVEAVEAGEMTVEVIRQKQRKREIPDYMLNAQIVTRSLFLENLRNFLQNQGDMTLRRAGFSVEFKGTEYETISEVWQLGQTYYSLLFNQGFPPLLIKRQVYSHKEPDFFRKPDFGENPLSIFDQITEQVFDMIRTPTTTILTIPPFFPKTKQVRAAYRRLVKDHDLQPNSETRRKILFRTNPHLPQARS